MTKVHLSKAERESHAWQKVRVVIDERLKTYRQQVENPTGSEADRLGLCWRIHELKRLLEIEEPPKENPDAGE